MPYPIVNPLGSIHYTNKISAYVLPRISKSRRHLLWEMKVTHLIWRCRSIWAGPVSETALIWLVFVLWRPENFRKKNPAWENLSNLCCSTNDYIRPYFFLYSFNFYQILHLWSCASLLSHPAILVGQSVSWSPFYFFGYLSSLLLPTHTRLQ